MAQTYYGPYSDFSDYSEQEVIASDVTKVEKVDFYHAYNIKYSYEYLENSSYEKTGNELTEYSKWTNNINTIDTSYEFEQCAEYNYQLYDNYNYFYLTNIGYGTLFVDYINIHDNKTGKTIMENNNFYMYAGDILIANVENYNPNNLEVMMQVNKKTNNIANMQISVTKELKPFSSEKIVLKTLYDDSSNKNPLFNTSKFDNLDKLLSNNYYVSICDTNISGKIISEHDIYRNIYRKYEYIIPHKEYIDLYTNVLNNEYLLDYDDSKIYYRYKTRDKITIKDNLTIDNKMVNINDFVIENTSSNISITSNLNLNINGIYNINFITPFKTINEKVTVDIKENYVDAIKEEKKYIDYLLEAATQANYSVDQKNIEIKDIIVDNTKEVNSLKEEINNYKLKLNQVKKENIIDTDKETKKQSVSILFLLSIFTIIFIIERIFYISNKRIGKNND